MDSEKIKKLIHQEIQNDKRLSQFNYDKIPAHTHNGVDTVKISQSDIINNNKYNIFFASINSETFTISNLPNINQIIFSGLASNEGVGAIVTIYYNGLSGTLHNGDTVTSNTNTFTISSFTASTMTVTVAVINTLPLYNSSFTTNASASGYITAIQASFKAIINGNVQFGNCYNTPSVTNQQVSNLSLANITVPFIQNCSSMSLRTDSLVYSTADVSSLYFAYVGSVSGGTWATAQVVSYNNSTITITTNLVSGMILQGTLILI